MKIKSEDILKPGAVLKVEKIDFNDPAVKRLLEETAKRADQMRKSQRWTQKRYDKLRQIITI